LRNLTINTLAAHPGSSCSHLRHPTPQPVAYPIDGGHGQASHSRGRLENATRHKYLQRRTMQTAPGALKALLKARRKIPFRRTPSKNVLKIM
jgi:hypothetical protein